MKTEKRMKMRKERKAERIKRSRRRRNKKEIIMLSYYLLMNKLTRTLLLLWLFKDQSQVANHQ
jgi:hypothetical protein